MVARTIRESGGVDVLVNNAGGTVDRLFMEKSREVGERELALNPVGPHKLHTSRSSPYDREAGGSIVSMGSDAGRMGEYREAVYPRIHRKTPMDGVRAAEGGG